MNLDKFVPPSAQKKEKFPVQLCACGNTTANTKNGQPFCYVCDVKAKRAADEAKGIPFERFPTMPRAMTSESNRSRETSNN